MCFVKSDYSNSFFKDGRSRSVFLYFRLFCIFIVQLVDKISPMVGFEPRICGVRSDRSTN